MDFLCVGKRKGVLHNVDLLMLQQIRMAVFVVGLVVGVGAARAQEPTEVDTEFEEILALDIDDLMVTSVAKREQKQTDAAAAVYVVTQEEIRRAGVFSIPEALRLVPGLQVARVSANDWAVSSRGFNGALSNKLLVMIDGRSIYTPVFSGTYWDDQSTMIQDIDRIEVIRGPGGTLYGANAMNGVVNIITKSAKETQGNLISGLGNDKSGRIEGRHGGKIDEDTFYRTYLQSSNVGASKNLLERSNNDDWYRRRTGFRIDGAGKGKDTYTLQGDAYHGEQSALNTTATLIAPTFTQTSISQDESYGGNVLGRWNHKMADKTALTVQAYVDYYTRKEYVADQSVGTADIQIQHDLAGLHGRHHIIYGGGARIYNERIDGTFAAFVNESNASHGIANFFVQDEYTFIPNTLYGTVGSKFEYNDYTGFEVQPNVRLAWHPTKNQIVWGAISRAVRTPSSIEEDVSLAAFTTAGAPPNVSRIVGNPNQRSEELIAYELGHRIQPTKHLSFDTALFYNDYDDIQTIGFPGAAFLAPDGLSNIIPYRLNNEGSGDVYGVEVSSNWNVTEDWRLTGSYSLLKMDLDVSSAAFTNLNSGENNAPVNQFSLRSYLNLTDTVQWDNITYYVDNLSAPVGSYLRYDTRLAWQALPGLEVSLIGRNLLDDSHPEFPATPQAQFSRGVIGQVLWKF